MIRIVVNKNTPYVVQVFERLGSVTPLDTTSITEETVRDADILIVRSETRVDSKLLDGSRTRFVGTVTIGTDHVDLGYLEKRGIGFANAPGSNADSVAEYIASALLTLASNEKRTLRVRTIGVVGVGNVGSKIVRVAETFGMKILQNDPPRARLEKDRGFLQLDELMESDIITLHVPLTRTGQDATYHLFDTGRIAKMKRGAVLINTSRGAVIETTALKHALAERHLSAAILDVWENEPAIDTELLSQVFIGTPHIAGYSLDGKVNAVQTVYESVCRHLSVPVDLRAHDLLPEPSAEPVRIINGETDREKIIAQVIKKCYDVEFDDRLLRQVGSVPEEERAGYFMRLRAGYRVRREFNNTKVEIAPEYSDIAGILRSLRFCVNTFPGP